MADLLGTRVGRMDPSEIIGERRRALAVARARVPSRVMAGKDGTTEA